MFKLLKNIAAHMPFDDDFKTLFEDLSLKFYLYVSNTIIVMNQNTPIKYVTKKMNDA